VEEVVAGGRKADICLDVSSRTDGACQDKNTEMNARSGGNNHKSGSSLSSPYSPSMPDTPHRTCRAEGRENLLEVSGTLTSIINIMLFYQEQTALFLVFSTTMPEYKIYRTLQRVNNEFFSTSGISSRNKVKIIPSFILEHESKDDGKRELVKKTW
jgi:hypothetical protein